MLGRLAAIAIPVLTILSCGGGGDGYYDPFAVSPPSPPDVAIVVTATPGSIEPGETSVITITARRSDGEPVTGTATVSTDLGALAGGTSVTVSLDAGRGTTTFTAPDRAGVATIRVQINSSFASTTVIVKADEGQVAVAPDVTLSHHRASSECEDRIDPDVSVTNLGPTVITFEVVDDLPGWLRVEPMTGDVPGTLRAFFTCDVGPGDHDLVHEIRAQGRSLSGEKAGVEDSVQVKVQVRP